MAVNGLYSLYDYMDCMDYVDYMDYVDCKDSMDYITYMDRIEGAIFSHLILVAILLIINRNFFGIYFSINELMKSIKLTYPLLGRIVISQLGSSLDKVLLTNYSGLNSLGYYSFGQKFAGQLKIFQNYWLTNYLVQKENFCL